MLLNIYTVHEYLSVFQLQHLVLVRAQLPCNGGCKLIIVDFRLLAWRNVARTVLGHAESRILVVVVPFTVTGVVDAAIFIVGFVVAHIVVVRLIMLWVIIS